MSQRIAALLALAGFVLTVMGVWLWGGNVGPEPGSSRVSFQIATGSTGSLYFPVGQAMAGIISHPPGMGRCETATVCGPAGVILSARTSEGAADNLRSVNQGLVDSGLSEGDVIAAAVKGQGAFRRSGKATHLRIIASLFAEQVHLVVAAKSDIHSVSDLRGKRVMLGGVENTGALMRARAILAAYRVSRVRIVPFESGNSAQLLREGKIDAFFTMTAAPLDAVHDLIDQNLARLVPLDGEGRDRLLRMVPQLHAAQIPAGVYPRLGAVPTVGVRAYWVTREGEPDTLIYGITRALFHPANRAPLAAADPNAGQISLAYAAIHPPAPLHSGAARFYREAGAPQ
jgi:TRAP transporter TAXI family solute receptor